MTVGEAIRYPPEEYSPVEQERLAEFRSRCSELNLTDEQSSNAHLIRWLRARNLNVDKALQMLKLSLEWRREHQVDGILEREQVPDDFLKMSATAYLGVDKDGYPILLTPMGRQDMRSALEKYGPDACFRFNLINMEKFMELFRKISKEQGRTVIQAVQIVDFEGFTYRQLTSKLCRDFMINMQKKMEPNYPEMLRYGIVINAPKLFYVLFNIVKPFIPKHTLEKVEIYGPEPEKWKKAIAEKLPLELIPPHWGGTRQGSDEFCSQDEIWGEAQVPLSFFTEGVLSSSSEDNSNLTSVTISPRDNLKIPLKVTKVNSSIAWRYRLHNHDIGFQITFQNEQTIVPLSRVESQQKQLQEGSHPCSQLGTYTLIFDNTYSRVRSKTVEYNVFVIEPPDKEEKCNSLEDSVPKLSE